MKKNTTKSTNLFLKFTAILLAIAILAGAAFFVLEFCSPADSFLKPSGWFQPAEPLDPVKPNDPTKDPDTNEPSTSDKELTDGSLKIGDVITAEGVRLSMTKLAAEDYEDYGVSSQAESAITLTITVEPDYAKDKNFDWTYRLKESDNDYLWGYNDYETPTQFPLSDFFALRVAEDTLSAVVECKRDFWEQFEIVATYRTNPNIQVSCTCDYTQKMIETNTGYFRKSTGEILRNFKLPSNPDSSSYYEVKLGKLTNGTILLDLEWDPLEIELNALIYQSDNSLKNAEMLTSKYNTFACNSDWLLQFFPEGERTPDKYSKLKNAYDKVCAQYPEFRNQGITFYRGYTLKKDGEVVSRGGCRLEVGIDFSANTILDATGDKDSVIF